MSSPPPHAPSARPALLAEVDAALMGAVAESAWAFFLFRVGAVALLIPGLAAVLAWGGDTGWRLVLLAVVEAVLLASLGYDLVRPAPQNTIRLRAYPIIILILHSAVIAVTGGVESPALPVYIPVTVVLMVVVGRRRVYGWTLIALSGLVLLFLAVRLVGGPIQVPAILRAGHPPALDPLYLSLIAAFELAFMAIGGLLGLHLRDKLDAAALEVSDARGEILTAVRAQNRELATLSSTLAHELKNPLAAIQSLSSLVARKLPPGSREAEQMGVLLGEVHRLGGVLDEFLNLSRPAEGLHAVPTDPAELLRSVARLYEARTREQGVTLELDAAKNGRIRCDPRKVRQVLINLVENALQHIPDGGWVRLALNKGGGWSRFTVEDDGPSPDPQLLRRAFDPGFSTRPEGSGLGLTVARAIARQHGGELTLEPRPGVGAIATLSLPLESSHLETAPGAPRAAPRTRQAAETT